jgi:YVTN family beta-propeller protein
MAQDQAGAAVPSGLLLVISQGNCTLSLVDPLTAKPVAEIYENAVTGHEVAASPDGRFAYVPIYGNSGVGLPGLDGRTLLVIDLQSRQIVHTLDFGHGVRPHCVRFDAAANLLYVTTELDRAVTIVDPKTLQIIGRVPTGQIESHMLALSPDGRRGYTANVRPGTVSVLDLRARRTIAIIPVAPHVQRIAISLDGGKVFTSDTTEPRLAVIDTATNQVAAWVALPGHGFGAAPTPDGRSLMVAIPTQGSVAVVDLATLKVTRTIHLPGAPREILVRPDGQVAYVSCLDHKVAALDLASWKVAALIEAGPGADGLAWAGLDSARGR